MATAAEVKVHFESEGADKVKSDVKDVGDAISDADKKGNGFGSGAIIGALATFKVMSEVVDKVKELGEGFLDAGIESDTYEHQLTALTHSASTASAILETIKQRAKSDPFSFSDLVSALEAMEARGEDALTFLPTLEDASAATGKSLGDTTDAFLQAQMGIFRGIHDFGIDAKTSADGLSVTFTNAATGMTVTAKNTSDGISQALMGMLHQDYGGATDEMANSVEGRLTRFKNNIHFMMEDVGKPIANALGNVAQLGNDWFDSFDRLTDSGLSPFRAALVATEGDISRVFGHQNGAVINGMLDGMASSLGKLGNTIKPVISLVHDGLDSAFSFLADHLKATTGAITGAVAAFGGLLAFSGLSFIFGPLIEIFGALTAPLLAVVAAAALLGAAYESNFLGFGDAVRSVASDIGTALSAIKGYFTDTFSDGLFSGLTKMADDVTHLGTVFPSFSDAFKDFGKEINDVKPLMSDLQDAFTAFGNHDWGSMFASLGSAAGDLGTLISDGVQAGVDAIRDLAGDLASWTMDVGVPTVTGWLTDHAGDMWTAIKDAAGWVGDVAAKLGAWTLDTVAPTISGWLEDAANLTGQITTWATSGLSGVNWSALMSRSMQESFSAGQWVAGAVGDIVSSLVSGLSDISVDWSSVGNAIGYGIGRAIQAVVGVAVFFDSIAANFIAGIVSSLSSGNISWSDVGNAILSGIRSATDGVHDLVSGLFTGLWDGLTSGIHAQVANALNDVISMVDSFNIPTVHFKLLATPEVLADALVSSIQNAAQKASAGLVNAMTGSTANNTGAGGSGSGQGGGEGAGSPGVGGGGSGWLLPQEVGVTAGQLDRGSERTVTTRFMADDQTSPVARVVDAAVRAVQAMHSTLLQQMGGEAVTGVAGVVHAALNAIPTAWHTAITQAGAEAATTASTALHAAIANIQTSHLTTIVQAGAEAATAASNALHNAINAIPTYHQTILSAYDAGASAVASAVSAAINAIPSSKTVSVTTVASTINARATGGAITSALTRLADGNGPELVETPTGGYFLAATDAIYPTTPGSYVYTAEQTRAMMGSLQPIPAYASGSGRQVVIPPQDGGPRIHMNVAIIDPAKIQEFFEVAESAKVLANVDELYALLGGA